MNCNLRKIRAKVVFFRELVKICDKKSVLSDCFA